MRIDSNFSQQPWQHQDNPDLDLDLDVEITEDLVEDQKTQGNTNGNYTCASCTTTCR